MNLWNCCDNNIGVYPLYDELIETISKLSELFMFQSIDLIASKVERNYFDVRQQYLIYWFHKFLDKV